MNPKDLHIETERLLIRPYTIEDAAALKKGIDESLPELLRFMPWAKDEPQSVEQKIERIERLTKDIEEDKDYTLGIFLKDTGEFIGSTGLHKRNRRNILEIGYWCATKHTGKGYITESSRALTNFAFNNLNADCVHIVTETKNIKSAAIPKKIGFKLEFSCRSGEFDDNCNRLIANNWVIFKEEWKS